MSKIYNELKNKKTLIIGDVNTGKTSLSILLLEEFLRYHGKKIVVIDLAPATHMGIGGKMKINNKPDVIYMTAEIVPPRLMGKTPEEVLDFATRNAQEIDRLFKHYLEEPHSCLFVNDISLYFHCQSMNKLIPVLESAETAILNGYFGNSLPESPISRREKEGMEMLMKYSNKIIHLYKI